LREEALSWLEVARRNLRRAEVGFRMGDNEACVFWSQQVVEFALKALWLALGRLPPKTHNLRELYEPVRPALGQLDEATLSELTPFYSASRYPDIFSGVPEIHASTAERFLSFAREVLARVEALLGGGARDTGQEA